MNINGLAKWITEEEGGSQQVNIAQVHDVLSAIKKIYKRYLELSPTPQDIPFRMNRFWRLLTDDWTKHSIDANEERFYLSWKGETKDYLPKKEGNN